MLGFRKEWYLQKNELLKYLAMPWNPQCCGWSGWSYWKVERSIVQQSLESQDTAAHSGRCLDMIYEHVRQTRLRHLCSSVLSRKQQAACMLFSLDNVLNRLPSLSV